MEQVNNRNELRYLARTRCIHQKLNNDVVVSRTLSDTAPPFQPCSTRRFTSQLTTHTHTTTNVSRDYIYFTIRYQVSHLRATTSSTQGPHCVIIIIPCRRMSTHPIHNSASVFRAQSWSLCYRTDPYIPLRHPPYSRPADCCSFLSTI